MNFFHFPHAIYASVLVVSVSLLLIVSWTFLEMNKMNGDEPFECGFETGGKVRLPFSIGYFLVGVMFVIFDAELVICLPLIGVLGLKSWVLTWLLVVEILSAGYILEVVLGSFDWKD